MITYVDTSSLIKPLIDDVGTAEAGRIWDEPNVLRDAVQGLELLWSQVSVVEIDEDLMRLARYLATEHRLRGYDAVHRAAAHLVGADVFSSADCRSCEAASSSGFHVANPLDAATATEPAAIERDDDSTTPPGTDARSRPSSPTSATQLGRRTRLT